MSREWRRFLLHFGQMLLAMLVGMAVVAGLISLAAAVGGESYRDVQREAPAVVLSAMAVGMIAPMAWWMGHRGYPRERVWEMALVMLAPTPVVLALLALGAGEGRALEEVQHGLMVPLMLAVMLLHRRDYSRDIGRGTRRYGLGGALARRQLEPRPAEDREPGPAGAAGRHR